VKISPANAHAMEKIYDHEICAPRTQLVGVSLLIRRERN
jgi:hypothetical protein